MDTTEEQKGAPPAYHVGPQPHPGGCEGCRAEQRCNACGEPFDSSEPPVWQGVCTNGRCRTCHGRHCAPGGSTTPGHGYGPFGHANRNMDVP